MNSSRDLLRITDRLHKFEPELDNRNDIIRNVMESAVNKKPFLPDRILTLLFGWIDYVWVRRVFGTASLAIVLVFLFQQASIMSRIGDLEQRMVESNTHNLLMYQGENVKLNSILLKETGGIGFQDSILVADRDLKELIESYIELQKRYGELQKKIRLREASVKSKL